MTKDVKFTFSNRSFYAVSGAAAVTALLFAKYLSSNKPKRKVLPSPKKTVLPNLSYSDLANLPYPPDIYPGTRDVETPYGSIRVYEWGPEDGRKVLLVHGISTPCIALGGVAEGLVQRGCRVMTFDLFGRGYSDYPADLPLDDRLYTTQILLALASSPLAWTGDSGFSLVGYSLGGAISVAFTSYFPHLVESLILLAPGGLIRPSHIGWSSKFLYSTGLFPDSLLQWLVKRRLRGSPTGGYVRDGKKDADAAVSAEAAETEDDAAHAFSNPMLSKRRPQVNATAAVSWQIANHVGFIPAFMSSIRYGPIVGQQAAWSRTGIRLAKQSKVAGNTEITRQGLHRSQVLMILGADDAIIVREEIVSDAREVLGSDHLKVEVLKAGHELPITMADEVVDCIWRFWTIVD